MGGFVWYGLFDITRDKEKQMGTQKEQESLASVVLLDFSALALCNSNGRTEETRPGKVTNSD